MMPVAVIPMRITIPGEIIVAQVPMRITIPGAILVTVPMRITIPVPPEDVIVATVPMRITIPGAPPNGPPPDGDEEEPKAPWLLIGSVAGLGAITLLTPKKGG